MNTVIRLLGHILSQPPGLVSDRKDAEQLTGVKFLTPSTHKYFINGWYESDELFAAGLRAYRIEATISPYKYIYGDRYHYDWGWNIHLACRVDVRFYRRGEKIPTYTFSFGVTTDSLVVIIGDSVAKGHASFRIESLTPTSS